MCTVGVFLGSLLFAGVDQGSPDDLAEMFGVPIRMLINGGCATPSETSFFEIQPSKVGTRRLSAQWRLSSSTVWEAQDDGGGNEVVIEVRQKFSWFP